MVTAIAHRGDPVAARENTVDAFLAAMRAGADMVELDLQRTKDGEIVVLHDRTLNRLWEIDADVSELEAAELAEIGAGTLRIPAFSDVLKAVPLPLMVDFTGDQVVEGAVRDIGTGGAMERSLFVSGNVEALDRVRRLAPEARIGLTWIEPHLPSEELMRRLRAEYWNPTFHLVTTEAVTEMHARGYRVSTWTVDDLSDMAQVVEAGVDAVVSNRIGELCLFLDGQEEDQSAGLA